MPGLSQNETIAMCDDGAPSAFSFFSVSQPDGEWRKGGFGGRRLQAQPTPLLQAAHTTITGSPHHYYTTAGVVRPKLDSRRLQCEIYSYGLYSYGPI